MSQHRQAAASGPYKPGRPTSASIQRRRSELLCVAIRHFVTYGLERSNIDAIACEAGVSKATVYRRYSDKFHLFSEASDMFVKAFIADLRDVGDNSDRPEDLLPKVAVRLFESMATEVDGLGTGFEFTRINWATFRQRSEFVEASVEVFRERAIVPLTTYLRRNAEQGRLSLSDPEEASWRFIDMTLFYSWTLCLEALPPRRERERLAEKAADLFLYGALSRSG